MLLRYFQLLYQKILLSFFRIFLTLAVFMPQKKDVEVRLYYGRHNAFRTNPERVIGFTVLTNLPV
ncbi:hypothetical protein D770_16975 [Flammeovirgaceae bacterium 311]|nr:hypothetical protein D770_16975 [Flammeovirgaceae bacterium 311]